MVQLENRLAEVTAELVRLLDECPSPEGTGYGLWARKCVGLGFERLAIAKELAVAIHAPAP
jgi:hypothetical protein